MWLSIHSHMLISVQKVSCSKLKLSDSYPVAICVFLEREGRLGLGCGARGLMGKDKGKTRPAGFFFFTKVQY